MKAAQINQYGDSSVVKISEIDQPTPTDGQVLVNVMASSLNPFDSMIRSGVLKDMIPLSLPITLGGDIAGEITEIGKNVTDFKVGDKIYGQANVVAGNSGAFAEYAVTKSSQIGIAPTNISIQEAASIPLIGVSAIQALKEHIQLKSGQKILITGGAGGIGQIAIQIAKHIGAYVATTATGEGIKTVTELGADQVLDYKNQDYTKILKDFDAAFDTVGHDELSRITQVLKEGAIAVSMVGEPEGRDGLTVISQMTAVTTKKLDELKQLVEVGVVKLNIGKIFKLDEITQAFDDRESGTTQGKIVLEIG